MLTQDAIASLQRLSAWYGADPDRVQGPGGNTSLKSGARIAVKASGTWLKDSLQAGWPGIFVTLDLPAARAAFLAGQEAVPPTAILERTGTMRPSIETSFHVLLPQPMIAHSHDLRVLARAIRPDASDALTPLLQGLDWALIPYIRPGLPLAAAIVARVAKAETPPRILILANHGLILCGQDEAEIRSLQAELDRRLPPLPLPGEGSALALPPGGEPPGPPTGWQPLLDPALRDLLSDPVKLARAVGPSLFPDAAVFFAGRPLLVPPDQPLPQPDETPARLLLAPTRGAFLSPDALPGTAEIARALARILLAQAEGGPDPAGLSPEQEAELLGWEAERWRQSLARTRMPPEPRP